MFVDVLVVSVVSECSDSCLSEGKVEKEFIYFSLTLITAILHRSYYNGQLLVQEES